MVKEHSVLIARFARRAGMSIDTVRYYIRRGLLMPGTGTRGGRNPYQVFTETDLDAATIIRTCQALGLGLREISAFLIDYRAGRLCDAELTEFLQQQQDRLRQKAEEMVQLIKFLEAKVGWIRRGKVGTIPSVADFVTTSLSGTD